MLDSDPRFGVDRHGVDAARFRRRATPSAPAARSCSPTSASRSSARAGRLEIEIPFNAPPDRPCRLLLDRTGEIHGTGIEVIEVDICNQYTIQAEEFATAILDNRPQPAPLEDAVANMACIDAILRSSQTGKWEETRNLEPGT